jgi:CYTH domain-containing protein
MGREIERKFLVDSSREVPAGALSVAPRQAYLTALEAETEVRMRAKDNSRV